MTELYFVYPDNPRCWNKSGFFGKNVRGDKEATQSDHKVGEKSVDV